MPRGKRAGWAPRVGGAWLVVIALAMTPGAARAERAWVKDELRLNLRTGPGVKFRIMGVVRTGDAVDLLERGEGWTRVRVPDLGEGWLPEGYLQGTPPAGVRLAQSEAQTSEFRGQLDELEHRANALQEQNETLAARDEGQRTRIGELERENLELRAGARWPEWITGAGILSAGMLLGALLRAMSARRGRTRIRL